MTALVPFQIEYNILKTLGEKNYCHTEVLLMPCLFSLECIRENKLKIIARPQHLCSPTPLDSGKQLFPCYLLLLTRLVHLSV